MAYSALLVGPDVRMRERVAQWLARVGFDTRSVATFEEAKSLLTDHWPDVLVTEARLARHNGLHLVILGHGRHPSMRALVIGPRDPFLAREARQHDATYLAEPLEEEEFVAELAETRSRSVHVKGPTT